MPSNPLKIILFGTPEFAVPILTALATDTRYSIVLVVSAPPRPSGRDQSSPLTAIEIAANRYDLKCARPEKLKFSPDFMAEIALLKADFFVVAAYGQIIPETYLSLPTFGAVNIHPSILPAYRGASPLQSAILDNVPVTGITIIKMDAELDHGPILWQKTQALLNDDTSLTLGQRLFTLASIELPNLLFSLSKNQLSPTPQSHHQATFTKLIDRDSGSIDWNSSAEQVLRSLRAYTPWPGIFSFLSDGRRLKILKATIADSCPLFVPGASHIHEHHLHIRCNPGCLSIHELQLEGKTPSQAQEFINGYARLIGSVLSSANKSVR